MKLYYDHVCGKQQDTDFIHCLVSAVIEEGEEDYALQNGWSPSNVWYSSDTNFSKNNKVIWYQSRQTRINLNKFKKTKTEKKSRSKIVKNDLEITITKTPNFDLLFNIYKKYVDYKNFKDFFNKKEFIENYKCDSHIFIIYGDCAFSLVEKVGSSFISHQFCWDYNLPSLGLGRFSTYHEIELAKRYGLKYLYLGASYEDAAIYKSSFSGFEFWTGRFWSDNREIYSSLVKKDSELSDIVQISNYYQSYFDSLSV